MSRRYVTTAWGQTHLTESARPGPPGPPLVCLHATAYSGQTFLPLIEALDGRRRVIAPDTAGYGGSDPPERRWDIEAYAREMRAAIRAAGEGPVDILGYHTGALLAAEIALQDPDLVRRIVMIGVPYYLGEARAERRATLAQPMALTNRLGQFAERWAFLVGERPSGMSLSRGFANFVDELRAYPHGWWAHDAAFSYAVDRAFPLVRQPVLILNPANHLSAPSRAAGAALPQAQVRELPHLSHAIFELAAEELADHVEAFLNAASLDRSRDHPASGPGFETGPVRGVAQL
ncbi:alpha/beta fold hydrolase [Phenylobacterium aquaticum]|uniref:alpha/beta fold hydrolase n=1 Tax=Phenylobacterium aquaticum TaxID=1763816 RepID=UPI0026F0D4FF|nr:alpha/beta hydrolase [Phenylobacterium aquaticum]